ncbi:MAG: molybdopterin-synthase adenylyltransferase MoeB [Burkholderiaceae bacterium]
MNDADLLRYSRHILLEEIGEDGQQRIRAAHVLVVGLGGLGSPVALYLGGAGVGHITLVDDDVVDLTNLQRQIAHSEARVGDAKVASGAEAIAGLNSQVSVHAIAQRADAKLLSELIAAADVVVDCCDNFATRQTINAACVAHRVPLVSGAALRFDGQLAVFDSRDAASPCYACVFPADQPPEETRCAVLGVFAPLVGIIGSCQAAEALKLVAQIGPSLSGRLLLLDARRMEWSELRVPRDPACKVCGAASALPASDRSIR